jgi:hypothetical protein
MVERDKGYSFILSRASHEIHGLSGIRVGKRRKKEFLNNNVLVNVKCEFLEVSIKGI